MRKLIVSLCLLPALANAADLIFAKEHSTTEVGTQALGVVTDLDGKAPISLVCMFRIGANTPTVAAGTPMDVSEIGSASGSLWKDDMITILQLAGREGDLWSKTEDELRVELAKAGVRVFRGYVTKKNFRLTWNHMGFQQQAGLECVIDNPKREESILPIKDLIETIRAANAVQAASGGKLKLTSFSVP